jgi:hypothetical protein
MCYYYKIVCENCDYIQIDIRIPDRCNKKYILRSHKHYYEILNSKCYPHCGKLVIDLKLDAVVEE